MHHELSCGQGLENTLFVRNQHHRRRPIGLAQEVYHHRTEMMVDIRCGLIKDEHLGVGNQRPSEQHPLQLSARQFSNRSRRIIGQLHTLQHIVDPAAGLPTRHLPAEQPHSHHLRYRNREMGVDAALLREIPDVKRRDRRPVAIVRHITPVGRQQPQDDPQQCRLTATVGALNQDKIAPVYLQRDIGERQTVVIPQIDMTQNNLFLIAQKHRQYALFHHSNHRPAD